MSYTTDQYIKISQDKLIIKYLIDNFNLLAIIKTFILI